MQSVKSTKHREPRKIEFVGDHSNDSIVIGNYGDAAFLAKGNFDLSGIIYCAKNVVEFNISGEGSIVFTGVCKKVLIRRMEGNCSLDLSGLTCELVWCEAVRGQAEIILGPTKTIELLSLDEDALVRYEGKPVVLNYSLRGNSRIECWKNTLYRSA